MTGPTSYRDAGVDIDEGNRAVSLLAESVASTRTPEVLSDVGAFGGLFAAGDLGPDAVLVASSDGVGTKVELAARYAGWRGVGMDLVNHSINDVLVQNARPLFFLDYIATAKLVPEIVAEIVMGMAEACRSAGCALLGGETAEMPGVYMPGAVDIAGTIVGVVDRADLLPRDDVAAGDVVVAMPSDSPHTNGFSLIRALLADREVDDSFIAALLVPHRCYLDDVAAVRAAGAEIKALAHITGGGFIENIPRVLPSNLGVRIDLGAVVVPELFATLVEWAQIPDREAFRVWNMGVGMVAVVNAASASVTGLPVIGEVVEAGADERVELTGSWR